MAIPTLRTKESPEIRIDKELCTGCGLCVSVCSDGSLQIVDDKVARTTTSFFDCIGCGHCMAICPTSAIEISGRELQAEDIFALSDSGSGLSYDELLRTLQKRRSIRAFKEREVEPEVIEKIIDAARTAPMGLPPSDVHLLVFDGKEKNRAFAADFAEHLKGQRFLTNGLFLRLMRPFWGKETTELFQGFIKPLFTAYTSEGMDKGVNAITYDAPLAVYFYGSPYCDPADPIIAATYAMVAAETLGLGTCMVGGIHPFIQIGAKSKKFREKHQIRCKSREGLFVLFGYPKHDYPKGINRTFAAVDYYRDPVV